jgi:hypothetical protein
MPSDTECIIVRVRTIYLVTSQNVREFLQHTTRMCREEGKQMKIKGESRSRKWRIRRRQENEEKKCEK